MRLFAFLLAVSAPALAQSNAGPPPAPTGVEASDGAYTTKVQVAWEHVRGAARYRIYRGETDDPARAAVAGETESILFEDKAVPAGREFFYWVRGIGPGGESRMGGPDKGLRAIGRTSAFGPIEPLKPPPAPRGNRPTAAKIYLGKTLFWDEQLSSTRTVACGTCHHPRRGGADPRTAVGSDAARHPGPDGVFGSEDDGFGSPGVPLNFADGTYGYHPHFGMRPQVTRRKALAVFEAAYTDNHLLWDGRASNTFRDPLTGAVVLAPFGSLESAALESQALMPILDEAEMSHVGRTWPQVVERLRTSSPLALAPEIPAALAAWIDGRSYPELFAEAFGDEAITPVRLAFAIASYQRTLFSDRTPEDAYVADIRPRPAAEQRGRDLFFANFCDECHRGPLVGDNRFRFIGVRPREEDRGFAEVTGVGDDLGRMRTPSLRNSALRGPFMHKGAQATLEDVIEFYNRGGDFDGPNKDTNFVRPMGLTEQEKSDLLAWLKISLTDKRVEAEAAPLFDRALLYAESARVPVVDPPPGPNAPRVVAIEPPFLGNPSFTVGFTHAPPGAEATLVIDDADPGPGPAPPATGRLFRGTVRAQGETIGYGSLSVPIPADPALAGRSFAGRWYVRGEGFAAASAPFRFTVFAPARWRAPEAPIAAAESVSAASFVRGAVAPGSIVSLFGAGLAEATAEAESLPLPEALAGTSVFVRDSAGLERPAPLFFVSAGQINYLAPPGTAPGEATVEVSRGGRTVARGGLQVLRAAPAVFAANADGKGPAAALVLRVRANGEQVVEQAVRFDEASRRFVAAPISLGPADEQVFLMLFATGLRGAVEVQATLGGAPAEVLFAGAQPEFAGLDQVNLRIDRALAGRGEIEALVFADGRRANAVTIQVR